MEQFTVNGTTYYAPYADTVRRLYSHEYKELYEDIQERGVIVPVIVDEQNNIIDGYHRMKIATELGMDAVPTEQCGELSEDAKEQLAWDLNAHRRQLTREERQGRAIKMRQQGMSYRAIAGELGVDPMTVRNDVSTVEFSTVPDRIVGLDGKERPAHMPPRPTAPPIPERPNYRLPYEPTQEAIKEKGWEAFFEHVPDEPVPQSAPEVAEMLRALTQFDRALDGYQSDVMMRKMSPEAMRFVALKAARLGRQLIEWAEVLEEHGNE